MGRGNHRARCLRGCVRVAAAAGGVGRPHARPASTSPIECVACGSCAEEWAPGEDVGSRGGELLIGVASRAAHASCTQPTGYKRGETSGMVHVRRATAGNWRPPRQGCRLLESISGGGIERQYGPIATQYQACLSSSMCRPNLFNHLAKLFEYHAKCEDNIYQQY